VGTADFSHTGTFAIIDLDGTTLNSLSGTFLTSRVPEPGSLGMLTLASVGLMFVRRRRRAA
jgi:hypothetical protein